MFVVVITLLKSCCIWQQSGQQGIQRFRVIGLNTEHSRPLNLHKKAQNITLQGFTCYKGYSLRGAKHRLVLAAWYVQTMIRLLKAFIHIILKMWVSPSFFSVLNFKSSTECWPNPTLACRTLLQTLIWGIAPGKQSASRETSRTREDKFSSNMVSHRAATLMQLNVHLGGANTCRWYKLNHQQQCRMHMLGLGVHNWMHVYNWIT